MRVLRGRVLRVWETASTARPHPAPRPVHTVADATDRRSRVPDILGGPLVLCELQSVGLNLALPPMSAPMTRAPQIARAEPATSRIRAIVCRGCLLRDIAEVFHTETLRGLLSAEDAASCTRRDR